MTTSYEFNFSMAHYLSQKIYTLNKKKKNREHKYDFRCILYKFGTSKKKLNLDV